MSRPNEGDLLELALSDLHESPHQPRFSVARTIVDSFKSAIEVNGGHFPRNKALVVRPRAEGGYEILEGHHRTVAAREAGLATAWAFVREADDREAMLYLAASNSQRSLAPVEHGRQALRARELGVDTAEYARRIGKSAESVNLYIRAYSVLERFGGADGPYINVDYVTLAALSGLADQALQGDALFQISHRKLNGPAARAVVAELKEGKPLWLALDAGGPPSFGSPRASGEGSHMAPGASVNFKAKGAAIRAELAHQQARAEILERRFGHLITDREAFDEEVAGRQHEIAEARRQQATKA